MNYQETVEYLYNRLPVFQNIGARAYKPGLSTTLELCRILGNPQEAYPCIHIGGTNGKGSSSHMIAAILQTAGFKVGLYTSPHLKSFTERIKVNGLEVSQPYIVEFVNDNISNIDRFNPTFFELTVSMAFSYFRDQSVDIAVIEVGMGGRLDSTNIITPVLSLITNISLDHTQYLGDTVMKIASEKAGIIKTNVPVVVSEYQADSAKVFDEIAGDRHASLTYAQNVFSVKNVQNVDGKLAFDVKSRGNGSFSFKGLVLDLTGSYQIQNVLGVLTSIRILRKMDFIISDNEIRKGLSNVIKLTGLKGRWQKLSSNPDVYCDTAHNEGGLRQTLNQFDCLGNGFKRYVIGFVGEKDIRKMLSLFPRDGYYYFTQPSNQRALAVGDLADLALEAGLKGEQYSNVNMALKAALTESAETDFIYVGGSTFVVADLEQL